MKRPFGRIPAGHVLVAALALAAVLPLARQWTATASAGDITTVAGGLGAGPATGVGQKPGGVTVVGGAVYVADLYNNVIRGIDRGTGEETIVAGDDGDGALRDGGPARSAHLVSPSGVAADPAGNLYIADRNNHRIRRVDKATGIITTVAGSGTAGSAGDGLSATLAQLNFPEGVAADTTGNLYIADTYNHRVRKVDTAGVITTVAGVAGPNGVGGGGFSGDGGPASVAQLQYPRSVGVAGQYLYIADSANNRVRRVDLGSGTITTAAGGGTVVDDAPGTPATSAKLNNPSGVAVDGSGRLLIADTANHRVRRVDTPTGLITTVAGVAVTAGDHFGGDGGPATAAKLYGPVGVSAAGDGSIVVADTENSRVRIIDPAGTITTLAGAGEPFFGGDGRAATDAQLLRPGGVAVAPNGALLVVDSGNRRIRRISNDGTIITVAGTGMQCPLPNGAPCGDGGPALEAMLTEPSDARFGPGGIYITANNRVRRIGTDGVITTVAGTGEYGASGDGELATAAKMFQPAGLAFDMAGNLFIADSSNNRVRRVDAVTGVITKVAGGATPPAVSASDTTGDGGPATSAVIKNPSSLAFDAFNNLFITDPGQQRVRLVVPGPDGIVNGGGGEIITTVAGKGTTVAVAGAPAGDIGDGGPAKAASLRAPGGLAFRGGSLLISDTNDHRLRQVVPGPDGIVNGGDGETITTLAGTGAAGRAGDGGSSVSAQLSGPKGLDVAPDGRVLIADAGNRRIRSIQGPDAVVVPPTIVASGGGTQHTTIGSLFTVRFSATVRNSAGQPAPGVAVTFTAPATGPSGSFADGTASATVVTDGFGIATAPAFTANDRAGNYQVGATAPGVAGEAVYLLTNDHGPVASVVATAGTPQSARVGTEFTTSLEVTVSDVGGNPVPGTAVAFTAPDDEPSGTFDTPSGGTSRTITVTSGEDGTATATTFLAGDAPGSYTVLAAADAVSGEAEFALTNTPGHSPVISAVAGTPQSTRVGSAFGSALKVGVRDEFDQPLAGVEVDFSLPGSGPSGTFTGGATSATATTDTSGVATAPTLTANATAGSWTASASAAGTAGTADFSLTNTAPVATAVRAVGGTPQSARPGAAFAAALRALVRDDAGNPMAGVDVAFTAPGTGPSATFPGGATTATATTDERGVAIAPALTANGTEGSYAVVARVAGVATEAIYRLANSSGTDAGGGADPDPPCPAVSIGPGEVFYPPGFSLVGLPEGTRLPPSPARLWSWWDQGARDHYGAGGSDQPLAGGRGYWKYFDCPTVVGVAPTGAVSLRAPLGAYHASIVGNPSDRPVTVFGHDYAARYNATRGYRMSSYRETFVLAPGQAAWVFAYTATTIRIEG